MQFVCLNHFGFFGSQNSRILTFFGFSHLYFIQPKKYFYQVLATRAYKKEIWTERAVA